MRAAGIVSRPGFLAFVLGMGGPAISSSMMGDDARRPNSLRYIHRAYAAACCLPGFIDFYRLLFLFVLFHRFLLLSAPCVP
jgi:hypothetical protein